MRFWNRTEGTELEDRLRSERPAPRPEFLRAVASRVDARRVRTSLRLRVAFASGLTLAMFVAVASVGAVSYAASGAQKAAKSFSFVLPSASPTPASSATTTSSNGREQDNDDGGDEDDDDDADDDQYRKDCFDRVKQDYKTEQETHKANMKAAGSDRSARRIEQARHRKAQQELARRGRECF